MLLIFNARGVLPCSAAKLSLLHFALIDSTFSQKSPALSKRSQVCIRRRRTLAPFITVAIFLVADSSATRSAKITCTLARARLANLYTSFQRPYFYMLHTQLSRMLDRLGDYRSTTKGPSGSVLRVKLVKTSLGLAFKGRMSSLHPVASQSKVETHDIDIRLCTTSCLISYQFVGFHCDS
ncbi:hypothetical protein BJ138DRAFT_758315 [Hygrophoropsis aurantiaca]|uniref:Uncharacterized protein n=1 Tax=Hygrophoropsis aurantiaca TaxID=72124 RepID=A0ACB7ZXM8_9AGAM|nr:hypothetical protein BJ138DRAFT_758315 [Hygrophoropsis aurantiaca]